ncbi:MAG TPA: ATP-binding cassette domain-containing protein [Gammaproteobacteria bacterium]|nr:ATP-binding cassette domain-containing protein [Gammaproteobacteria bacterium]
MIEVKALAKRFGAVQAIDDVSFRAEDGCVTGLLGPNGAGKTTTLRILTGLMSADAGSVSVDGCDVATDRLAAQSRVGVLPDSRGLYPRLTPREHIDYFGRLQGVAETELRARREELIAGLGLTELGDRRVAAFSHGERNKVALARALVHDPHNVVLDEPTHGLDVASTRAMRALIGSLRERGRCVLFTSHVMQEVSALCDRIVVIAKGAVVADGTPDALRERTGCGDLEDAFIALVGLTGGDVEARA